MKVEVGSKYFPSSYILNFDELSSLREKEHEEAFHHAIRKFVLSVELILGGNAQIFIPEKRFHKSIFALDGWIALSVLLTRLDQFSQEIYCSEQYEFVTKLKACKMEYSICFNTDPVAFWLKRTHSAAS